MPSQSEHNLRLVAASLFALVLSSYLFAHGAQAAELRDISKVNGGIRVTDNEIVGEVSSVNGGIDIGRAASASAVETVNGGIDIENAASVVSAETVNGGIRLGEDVTVQRSLETVNGGIRSAKGSKVGGSVETVNGKISLSGVHVGDSVITTNGDVVLQQGTVIEGDVVFEGRRRAWYRLFNWGNRKPSLIMDADTVVRGDIRLYHEVNLKIEDGAQVGEIRYHYND